MVEDTTFLYLCVMHPGSSILPGCQSPSQYSHSKRHLKRIEKEYLTPGKALHSWYITEDLILLADDDIEEDVKLELLKAR